MLSCEGVGRNIEKAIEDALFNLKAQEKMLILK